MSERRIINLDLFRAIAILFVIFFHVTQMYVGKIFDSKFYIWGKYGVEFFFVLSGFLVGGLYYKQKKSVNMLRFWFLRFFRTYPPYIVALAFSFLSVYFSRHEKFDFGYLIFIHNFYTEIPFFKISWSLCIEEHFYLFFPILIFILEKIVVKPKLQLIFWLVISLLPTCFRWSLGSVTYEKFGYYETATLFRFEGIAMGCLLAFVAYRLNYKITFNKFATILILLLFVSTTYLNVNFKDLFFTYCFGYTLLNISILLVLIRFYYSNGFAISKLPFVFPIASMAYSLYLTHALVINFMPLVATKFHLSKLFSIAATLLVVPLAGYLFYTFIEKPTINIRNRLFIHKTPDQHKALNHSQNSRSARLVNFLKFKV